MTRKEALLLKVMEECDELSQRCSKAIRFTLEEVQPDIRNNPRLQDNAQRITEEFKDLFIVFTILVHECHLPHYEMTPQEIHDREKRIEKYMNLSESLGTITD